MLRRALIIAIVGALWTSLCPAQERPSITVGAAISLTDALTALASEYKDAGGATVRFVFAASNVLARQIVSGAPMDLFISADVAQMTLVSKAGLIADGTRVDLLSNELAIVVPDDRPRTFTSIRDLLDPAFKRVAMGDPAAVPAGVYGKQYLEHEGLWTELAPRIVPTVSVRAALAAVESGAADAAVMYRTDARTATRASVAFVVPASRGPRIVYPAAVIRSSSAREDAARFLDFLQSERAMRIFTQFGFLRASRGG